MGNHTEDGMCNLCLQGTKIDPDTGCCANCDSGME